MFSNSLNFVTFLDYHCNLYRCSPRPMPVRQLCLNLFEKPSRPDFCGRCVENQQKSCCSCFFSWATWGKYDLNTNYVLSAFVFGDYDLRKVVIIVDYHHHSPLQFGEGEGEGEVGEVAEGRGEGRRGGEGECGGGGSQGQSQKHNQLGLCCHEKESRGEGFQMGLQHWD